MALSVKGAAAGGRDNPAAIGRKGMLPLLYPATPSKPLPICRRDVLVSLQTRVVDPAQQL